MEEVVGVLAAIPRTLDNCSISFGLKLPWSPLSTGVSH